MIGILAEKPSAKRNMIAALCGGGSSASGVYNGEKFVITAARGHLYTMDDPDKQVSAALAPKYKSWELDNLPWNETDFKWSYHPSKDAQSTLDDIKSTLSQCDEICIATDDDPTGEGELLAWEILDQLKLAPKKWSRMYFIDESKKELQKAFVNRKPIKSMQTDADYIKAFYRARWDFLSMQFTRIATKYGDGYSVLRQGRLKSAMVLLVGDQLAAVNAYKKIPYYQNRFKDENGVIYTNPEEKSYEKKEDVPQIYKDSDVVCDGKQMKSTAPPKMLDLASLSARLVSAGYKAKEVTDTYQKMYESQVVSYPRTEDKVITPEQFDELLPLVDKIASVVGVDPSLLTHRTARSTHVKTGGAHGANRPGTNVPSNLAALDKFDVGKAGCARAIYELLAKNYLATLAEDYEYESQKGHIKDYPDFVGTAAVPKAPGWKLVYDADAEPDEDENAKGLGTHADPYVHEGFPPKPATPTMKWLMKQLEKRDVGTGATRTSTYADVTNEHAKFPLLKDTKGKISMTDCGEMSYRMLPGTNIGSLDVTEKLMKEMREIGEGKKDPEACLKNIQQMVKEDLVTMKANGEQMRKDMKVSAGATSPRIKGTWNGKEVSFKQIWGGHTFTDEEAQKLLAGETITFEGTNKEGKPVTYTGSLAVQEYKGKKFVGFKSDGIKGAGNMANDVERCSGTWKGKEVSFKKVWSGHTFTDEECQKLLAGEYIDFKYVSKKTNSEMDAHGCLKNYEYNGHPCFGFQLDNSDGPRVPRTWAKHVFTDDEKAKLLAGEAIELTDCISKKNNTPFAVKVTFGLNEKGEYGIIPHFNN